MFNALFELIGTYLHETSHLIVGVLTGAKITNFTIFPTWKITNDSVSITYGSVSYIPRWKGSMLLISLSPFLLWLLPYYYLPEGVIDFDRNFLNSDWNWFFHVDNWWFAFLLLFTFQGGFPSSVDYSGALKGLFSFGGIAIIAVCYLYFNYMEFLNGLVSKLNLFLSGFLL